MKKLKKALLSLLLINFTLTTTGCKNDQGGSAGVTGGTNQTVSSHGTIEVDRTKSIESSREVRTTMQIPATTIILEALISEGQYKNDFSSVAALEILKYSAKEWVKQKGEISFWQIVLDTLEKEGFKDSAPRRKFLFMLNAATGPSPFWTTGRNEMEIEVRMRALALYFTIEVCQKISDELSGKNFKSKEEAIEQIKEHYANGITAEEYIQILEDAFSKIEGKKNITMDTASGKDVSFRINNDYFVFSATGNTVTGTLGRLWGDGWLNGQQTTFSVERGTKAGIARSKTIETKKAETNETKVGAEAGVK